MKTLINAILTIIITTILINKEWIIDKYVVAYILMFVIITLVNELVIDIVKDIVKTLRTRKEV